MADQLKKAIVEEESNQNLDKAVLAYKGILAQFDDERKTAAAALFRLADCYRKQGNKSQAIAAYRRVLEDFPDQSELTDASRYYLTKVYGINPDQTAATQAQQQKRSDQQVAEARQRYRQLLLQQIQLVEMQFSAMQKKIDIGQISREGPEMTALRMELLDLQRTLAAFDAGALPIPSGKIK
jgi:tetratricopeptide (TPR) repeat protein